MDGGQCMVNMDIRKVPDTNGRFYIHSINTKKLEPQETQRVAR